MAKKKMPIPQEKAVLVKGQRWYIKYYQTNPATGLRERFRETFDLNRIKDLEEREAAARQHVREINAKLPLGFPFEEQYSQLPSETNILAALEVAKKVCCDSDRENTNRNIRSMCNIFTEFLEGEGLTGITVGEFRKSHAVSFMDYAVFDREVEPRTYNNYKERLTSIFKALKQRGYVKKNWFKKFKKKRVHGKQRRAFSEREREIVAEHISQTDPWMTLGILLQYHCFIRPIELRRLQFHMIDLIEGTIRLTSDETKNRDNDIVTIPDDIAVLLRAYNFQQYRPTWLVFGEGGHPHPDKACGHGLYWERHRNALQLLHDKGKLLNIKGLSYYSWKDTGAMELFKKKVNMLEIMKQLRHKDLATTQKYCQSLYVINEEIKALPNALVKSVRPPVARAV